MKIIVVALLLVIATTCFASVVPSHSELKKQVKSALKKGASIKSFDVEVNKSVYTATGAATIDGVKSEFAAVFDCSSDVCEVKDFQVAEVKKGKKKNAVTATAANVRTLSFPTDTSMMIFINGKLQTSTQVQVAKNDMVVVQKISSERAIPVKSLKQCDADGNCQTISPVWRCNGGIVTPSTVISYVYSTYNLAFNLNLVNKNGIPSIWVRNSIGGSTPDVAATCAFIASF